MTKPFNLSQHLTRSAVNLRDINPLVGTGNPAIDKQAFEDALWTLWYTEKRELHVPPGQYVIADTIIAPPGIENIKIQGLGGYDGHRGAINFSTKTVIKWVGPVDVAKAMVKFNWPSGIVWSGVSLNCDYKAGYGLQLTSEPISSPNGGVKNIIERCTMLYAKRDGIIIGSEGPGTAGATRQFFGSRFVDLTMLGCARSGIHVNETNADQLIFDSVMVYADDGGLQDCDNGFWFDHGGQYSELRNCQWGNLPFTAGAASKGYAIRNEAWDTSGGGAHGLQVTNFWSESPIGGLYYGITSTEDDKSFNFDHCTCFVESGLAVFIDKGTSSPIPYTFNGCTFNGDIKMNSAQHRKYELTLNGCRFKAGKGVRAADDILTENGFALMNMAAPSFPRFASHVHALLTGNIGAVWVETGMAKGERISLSFKQDAVGGRVVVWPGSGQFSASPAIPAANVAPNAVSVFNFVSDGALLYYTGGAVT